MQIRKSWAIARPVPRHNLTHDILWMTVMALTLLVLSACAPSSPAAAPMSTPAVSNPSTTESAPDLTGFPLTLESCGITITYEKPPERAITLSGNATWVMLALGLGDKLIGVNSAGRSPIPPEFADDYAQLTILAEGTPSHEIVVGADPDFIYASTRGAFRETTSGTREAFQALGINTYLAREYCLDDQEAKTVTIDDIYTDIRNIGQIFGVSARAEEVVADMQATLDEVASKTADVTTPVRVFYFDSGQDTPVTAGGAGMANELIQLAHGKNILEDFPDEYGDTTWELVVERDPEVIVIADYGETSAEQKREFLLTFPPIKDVTAIKEGRLVVIPLSFTIAGIQNATAVQLMAEAFYPELFAETEPVANSGFPVTVESCGIPTIYEAPPQRAVTMNQAATEIMLALGLEGKMVGTASLDDAVLPQYQDAYASIPVLSTSYPSQEVLFGVEPDFIYGSYRSAFGEDAAGPRVELAELGINSYLSVASCEEADQRPEKVTFATLYDEISNIGRIFGVADRADALIGEMQATLDDIAARIGEESESVRIFWYDSEADAPYVGSCCGAPAMLMEAVGAENIFADAPGTWANVTWEEVVAREPNVIVLADAEWSTAQEKQELLLNDPTYASIPAVQNQHFVAIPFGATTLGIRNVEGVVTLARGLYPEEFE